MRFPLPIFAIAAALTLLATAQEKPAEPDFAKVPEPPSAEEIAARKTGIQTARNHALNLAHQLAASQGFRRRDTFWTGTLPEKGFTIIPLQLFAGNEYYITLGTDSDADNLIATAFDPGQMLVSSPPDSSPGKLVLHLKPKKSGPHYLRIHQKKAGKKPTHCALTYVYR